MISDSSNETKDQDAKSDRGEARGDTAPAGDIDGVVLNEERAGRTRMETPAKGGKCIGGLEAGMEEKEELEGHLAHLKQDSACDKEVLPQKVASTMPQQPTLQAPTSEIKSIGSLDKTQHILGIAITPRPSLTVIESMAGSDADEEEPDIATATSVSILKPTCQPKIISITTPDSSDVTDSSSSDDTSSSADESVTTPSERLPEAALKIPEGNISRAEGCGGPSTPDSYPISSTPSLHLSTKEGQRGKRLREISSEVKDRGGRLKRTASLKLESAKGESRSGRQVSLIEVKRTCETSPCSPYALGKVQGFLGRRDLKTSETVPINLLKRTDTSRHTGAVGNNILLSLLNGNH